MKQHAIVQNPDILGENELRRHYIQREKSFQEFNCTLETKIIEQWISAIYTYFCWHRLYHDPRIIFINYVLHFPRRCGT